MSGSVWAMSEDELFAEVIARCDQRGIRWIHIDTPYRNKSPHLRGFPDLQLFGTHRTAYRELKTQIGRMRPNQTAWKHRLLGAGQDWALWRPSDILESDRVDLELDALCRPAPPPGLADRINGAFARALAGP